MFKTLFNDELTEYIAKHSTPKIHPLIRDMHKKVMEDTKSQYNTPLSQLQFIYLICKLKQPNKILEIGFFRGLASITMSLASNHNTKIDLLDITNKYAENYQYYWEKSNLNNKATIYIDKATNTLKKMIRDDKSSKYDLIYIDANKSEYPIYYKLALELTKPNGIILIDNVLWKGEITNNKNPNKITKSIQTLNNDIKNDMSVTSCLIPIEDGLYIIQKK